MKRNEKHLPRDISLSEMAKDLDFSHLHYFFDLEIMFVGKNSTNGQSKATIFIKAIPDYVKKTTNSKNRCSKCVIKKYEVT